MIETRETDLQLSFCKNCGVNLRNNSIFCLNCNFIDEQKFQKQIEGDTQLRDLLDKLRNEKVQEFYNNIDDYLKSKRTFVLRPVTNYIPEEYPQNEAEVVQLYRRDKNQEIEALKNVIFLLSQPQFEKIYSENVHIKVDLNTDGKQHELPLKDALAKKLVNLRTFPITDHNFTWSLHSTFLPEFLLKKLHFFEISDNQELELFKTILNDMINTNHKLAISGEIDPQKMSPLDKLSDLLSTRKDLSRLAKALKEAEADRELSRKPVYYQRFIHPLVSRLRK